MLTIIIIICIVIATIVVSTVTFVVVRKKKNPIIDEVEKELKEQKLRNIKFNKRLLEIDGEEVF